MSLRITPESRLALLMHDNLTGNYGKMGLGLLRYSEASVVAVIDRGHPGGDLFEITGIDKRVPIVASVNEALKFNPDTLVPGVAPPGGALPADWWAEVKEGLAAGMSLVNGLHRPLADDPELKPLLRPGRWIWDVRKEPEGLDNGSGAAASLSCKRVLTVGTDMAIGKMTASLELDRAAKRKGVRSKFLASGQIGICIAGEGVALDAVRVDFATGAVESMVMERGSNHDVLFVEGQGSIFHPASSAWLALIRGSMPTHLILVHRAGQEAVARAPWVKIPPLKEAAKLYEAICSANGALPPAKVAGIALNCSHLDETGARRAVKETAEETGLPTADVVRFGAGPLLEALEI